MTRLWSVIISSCALVVSSVLTFWFGLKCNFHLTTVDEPKGSGFEKGILHPNVPSQDVHLFLVTSFVSVGLLLFTLHLICSILVEWVQIVVKERNK